MTIGIVTDSTCDLPSEVIAEHRITVVPLYVNFGAQSYLDGVDLSRSEFYARLPSASSPPVTSAPGTEAFREVYQRLIREGVTGILSIHIASALSNVQNVARIAATQTSQVPVHVLDGGQITLGTGFLAVHAARLAASGASLEAIAASTQSMASRIHSFAALDTLEYLRRGGRVSVIMFSVGTLLQLKPIIKMHAGEVVTERARTSSGAARRLVDLASLLGPLEGIALVHSNAPDRLEQLRRTVEENLPSVPIQMVGEVAPVIGAHVGPGAVGIVCIQSAAPHVERS